MARAAGIHDGCNSRADAENIGIHAEGPEPVHQMQMNVDQSRRDNETFDVNNGRAVRLEIGSYRSNDAVTDMNIILSV